MIRQEAVLASVRNTTSNAAFIPFATDLVNLFLHNEPLSFH